MESDSDTARLRDQAGMRWLQAPSDAAARQAAAELYAQCQQHPDDLKTNRAILTELAQFGSPEADWYPSAIAQLLALADRLTSAVDMLEAYRQCALSAAPGSPIAQQATARFALRARYLLPRYQEHVTDPARLAHLLLSTSSIAGPNPDLEWGRNASLPPCPEHPIVAASIELYWLLVQGLVDARSGDLLCVLVAGVTSRVPIVAGEAEQRLNAVFAVEALRAPMSAGEALGALGRASWYTGTEPACAARYTAVFRHLLPQLRTISEEAATLASQGMNRWSTAGR